MERKEEKVVTQTEAAFSFFSKKVFVWVGFKKVLKNILRLFFG
jgi:hypothetical protein